MKKKHFITAFILFLLFCVFAVIFTFYTLTRAVSRSSESSVTHKLEVPYGRGIHSIADELEENRIIRNRKIFYICARYPKLLSFFYKDYSYKDKYNNIDWNSWTFSLKSGIYHISSAMNVPDILLELTSGQQEYIRISIPEGYTVLKIAELLQKNNICTRQDFIDAAHSEELINRYGIPSETLEGYLFPDTYYFNNGMEAQTIAGMMLDNFFEKTESIPSLYDMWKTYRTDGSEKAKKQFQDTVILASIIEREYKIKEEAPLIASVFSNRLKHNIGLYSCATIEYIISDIQGKPHPERILIEDTKIDSPYNTYKYAGLPPGAISNPGLTALSAAAAPAKTNYYYFQIVDADKGRHVFSTTFEEHKENHNLLLK